MMTVRNQLSSIASLTAFLLIGCSSPGDMARNNAPAIKQAEHLFELTCRETAQFLAVDPVKARSYVPDGYTVFVTGQLTADATSRLPVGQAVCMMIYQECSTATWDGLPLAPLRMQHQWIRIEGPHEILPVPGASATVPTYYWYMLDNRTTNASLRDKFREAGITSSKVASIALGRDVDGVRTGRVIEKDEPGTKNDIGYSFIENNRPSDQIPIGINHRLFHETCEDKDRCALMKALDSGFIIPFGSGSPVTVTAHPDSSVSKLWGATTIHGFAMQFEHMEFKVRISSGIPVRTAHQEPGS